MRLEWSFPACTYQTSASVKAMHVCYCFFHLSNPCVLVPAALVLSTLSFIVCHWDDILSRFLSQGRNVWCQEWCRFLKSLFLPNENEWTRATAHTRTLEPPRSFTDSSGRQLGNIKKAKLFSNEKPESSFEIQEKRTGFRQMTWYAVRLTTTLTITALADEFISQFRDFEEFRGFFWRRKNWLKGDLGL